MLSKNNGYPWIDRQLDLATWSDQKDDYIVYTLERAAGKLENNIEKRLCNSKFAELSDSATQVIPMSKDRFAKRLGDIIFVFKCPEKLGKVAPMKNACINKVPLEGGLYMNPFTRIASKHASKIDCSSHFPLTVLSEDGWITISDTIQPAIAPREMKLLDEKVEHENMKTGGIYRPEALSQFEDILEYGSFHEATLETLGYGICRKEGGPCALSVGHSQSMSAHIYDLTKLTEKIENEFSVFSQIDAWITKYGGYLALINIIGWTAQLLIAAGMVTVTTMKDGLDAGIAAIYAVLCFLPNQVGKVRRQAARKRTSAPPPDDVEPMFMKPL